MFPQALGRFIRILLRQDEARPVEDLDGALQ